MTDWPLWWEWELEFTSHVMERMVDRQFSETDLRLMLDEATDFREDYEEGRFAIETTHQGRPWEIIVEPVLEGRCQVSNARGHCWARTSLGVL